MTNDKSPITNSRPAITSKRQGITTCSRTFLSPMHITCRKSTRATLLHAAAAAAATATAIVILPARHQGGTTTLLPWLGILVWGSQKTGRFAAIMQAVSYPAASGGISRASSLRLPTSRSAHEP
ncbi:hypothetical protein F4781DRAFT_429872 [Annulohypoxylon bovei var. microspora]|nr:hypothetical protein F4781DRAFT_429872 [Annulohypoxylon bovei var. microspora]